MSNNRHEPRQTLRSRFWIEATLAVASAALLVTTLMWHDWLELVFGIRPDHGDGSLEWLFVIAPLLAASASSALARSEWRRTRLARPRVGSS